MADEQYRWLDGETAERLLSGEPPEAVEGAHRGEAERLARTLGALSVPPAPTSEELPGEAAAVAAFRKAREERADAVTASTAPREQAPARTADAGLVRIGTARVGGPGGVRRSRGIRPAGLALAASLAVGTVGGVAVVAGTGVLGTPFGGDETDPGASVSAATTPPERLLVSPSPTDSGRGEGVPGDDAPNNSATGGAGDPGRNGTREDTTGKGGADAREDRPDSREAIARACRDLRDGKRLDDDRRRALRDAAGGTRVWKYCKGVLFMADPRSGEPDEKDTGQGQGQGHGKGRDGERDRGQDREADKAERKAERKADRKPDRKDDQKAGRQAGAKRTDAGHRRTGHSLAPLRPALLHAAENFWPKV
ncbi:hypothetical protein ABTX62_21020 [Streptomyces sp. NPDC096046]|uniref:hypothetical protein n=1 Tax=Streptomyces sp. NPDC096046 TaxID=3155542 RepID=UPI003327D3B9